MLQQRSRRAELIAAAGIQGIGSAALLIAVAVLANAAGPVTQGAFNALKAQFDFLAAMFLVGSPQALFYFVDNGRVSKAQALFFCAAHAGVSSLLILVWSIIALGGAGFGENSLSDSLVIAGMVGTAVAYGGLRGVVLSKRSTTAFSLISAAPNFIVFFLVLASVYFSENANVLRQFVSSPLIFLIAYGLSMIAAFGLVKESADSLLVRVRLERVLEIFKFGFATWLPAVCQSGSLFFAIIWLRDKLSLEDGVGAFTTAYTLALILLTPLNLVIPIYFKWWTPLDEKSKQLALAKTSLFILVLSVVALTIIAAAESLIIEIIFGEQYLVFTGIYVLMAASVIPEAALRLWGVYCNSSGRPQEAAKIELGRLLLIVGMFAIFATDLSRSAIVWVLADYFMLIIVAISFVLKKRNSRDQ